MQTINHAHKNYTFDNNTVLQKEDAIKLDENDPIAHAIPLFDIPKNTVYLDGNSLGPLPNSAKKMAVDVVENQWGKDLITSWNKHEWINLPTVVGNRIAPLIGADEGQVVSCDSISVNLFKLLACALQLNTKKAPSGKAKRNKVLSQQDNFPTDLYMVEGLQQLVGAQHCSLLTCKEDEIVNVLQEQGQEISVLLLTHVNFRSGKIHDMQQITKLAHDKGILVIWDLAHSAGAVPVQLDHWNVDFAVGCGYKYLNGGPGAPAFIYAAKKHIPELEQPLTGWMGHAKPFTFDPNYAPDMGIKKFLSGTPSVISMAVLNAALDVFDHVDIGQIREKSVAMTCFFQRLVEQSDALNSLTLASPESAEHRGAQLAYKHENAYALCQALISEGVIADFRAPDIIRFGFSPTFLSFSQLYDSVEKLSVIIQTEKFKDDQFNQKQAVT